MSFQSYDNYGTYGYEYPSTSPKFGLPSLTNQDVAMYPSIYYQQPYQNVENSMVQQVDEQLPKVSTIIYPQQFPDEIVYQRMPDGSHACPICYKTFGYPHALRGHYLRVHLQQKRFTCKVCNAGFWSNSDLERHMPRHTGQKFICDTCGKSYTSKQRLTEHFRNPSACWLEKDFMLPYMKKLVYGNSDYPSKSGNMMSSFASESESEIRTKVGKDQKSSCSSKKSFKHYHRCHRHRKVYIKIIKPLEKTWLTLIIVLTQFFVTVLVFGMLIFQKEYYHVFYLESINPSLIICVIFQMIISFFLGCAYCLPVKLGAAMGITACIVASFTEAAVVFYLTFADLILSHCYETPCTFVKGNYQKRMGFAAILGIFSFLHFLFAVCYVLDGTRKPQIVKTPLKKKKKSKSSRASESSQKSRSRLSTLSTSEVVKKRAKDGCQDSIKISRRTISQSSQINDFVLQKRSKTTKLEKFIPISYSNPSQTSEKSTSWTTNFSGPSNISHAVCNTPTCPRYNPQIFVPNSIVQTSNSIVNFGTENDQNLSIIINLPQNIENEQGIVEIQRVIVHLPKQ